jgi:uncharacterized protein (UPF0371 family)
MSADIDDIFKMFDDIGLTDAERKVIVDTAKKAHDQITDSLQLAMLDGRIPPAADRIGFLIEATYAYGLKAAACVNGRVAAKGERS